MHRTRSKTVFVGTLLLVVVVVVVYFVAFQRNGEAHHQPDSFDGVACYEALKWVCEFGPRYSGSDGMRKQQEGLIDYFKEMGGKVSRQDFKVRHPETGGAVKMSNLIVEWHPERSNRILLCAHYDTRPFPDEDPDPRRRRDAFIGANDGASGVAVLCELARHMPKLSSRYGVDFVLFDGEELIYDRRRDSDRYFLGSKEFARWYAAGKRDYKYRYGVLLDMVGDRTLNLYMEKNSLKYARGLVQSIWKTAKDLGVNEFIHRSRHEIRDDHLALNQIARIPTCDIIDFDYPRPGARFSYWHTTSDTPDKCSAESLAKVGTVVLAWLKRLK